MAMFKKILVANRGEIACRVFKTAKRLGIGTVAVYSDADRGALHVQMADEAVHIGPSASSESYLVIDKIIEACKKTGADAVHPGYGFLSENRAFQEALVKEGITFIGPESHAIYAMGDKIESKKLAREAGVNTVPGYLGVIKDADEAVKIANEVGYPVMLKASAGGGGKGMRLAWNDTEAREGFISATNEAKSSFGDDRVFVEKFIQEPRHIEIQVIADTFGNTLYLGERECSIQRRHQKVIEEAPSPFLTPELRQQMGEQAVALAKSVNYRSAGTVEFIVGGATGEFYFLEMNTRLQVEHPVTEMVTGLDLVELMIRVAAGEKLPLTQEQVKLTGWAIESRVYAEDPFRNFMPSTGRLTRYLPPAESDNVRVDTGVYEGGEVSMFYDPMIAKLITYGATREEATAQMVEALDAYYIRGVNHNISFLNALMVHPRFHSGELTTNFIAEEFPDGFSAENIVHDEPDLPVVVAAAVNQNFRNRAASMTGQARGLGYTAPAAWKVLIGDREADVSVILHDKGYSVVVDGKPYEVLTRWKRTEPLFVATINNKPVSIQVDREGVYLRLFHRGASFRALVVSPATAALNRHMLEKAPPDLSKFLLSPMPGLLTAVAVKAGDEVKAGEELAVVEAMKMENSLRATQDGVVKEVLAEVGASLVVDQPIIEFE
ncbi:MAG: acetyl/propionyl/methylcrotonyl-CoA carboxylase subunit alpha [Porticoccaceae bacterium]|nr:acetyl/propionyl/methylcrotonyl-CoA carboxylase subunit alpha [Porticoccaceae bacterium]